MDLTNESLQYVISICSSKDVLAYTRVVKKVKERLGLQKGIIVGEGGMKDLIDIRPVYH
jgi:hypothetical protein